MSLCLVFDKWRGAIHVLEHDTGCTVVYCITKYKLFVDFKLSTCSECCMISYGQFLGV